MRTPTKLSAFAAALAVVFVIAFGIGRAVGPIGDGGNRHGGNHVTTTTGPGDHPTGGH